MIKVTLEFANQSELLAFFATGSSPDVVVVKKSETVEAPKVKTAVDAPKTKAVAVAPTAPAPTPAPAASSTAADEPTVDYATLQKAVFALVGLSREAAAAVASSFGVATFKELTQGQWGKALTAVNVKLAELEKLKAVA